MFRNGQHQSTGSDAATGSTLGVLIDDSAVLSDSPIVIIDEIENAGIDKMESIRLLMNENSVGG